MQILRTPDDRFAHLPGFPFAPNYLDSLHGSDGCRVHYVDEGPADADVTWLCLHGEPTWSYLYRKMIPVFDRLDLRNIRLVYQDWGGLLGLTLPMSRPDRFSALLVMNSMLGTGDIPLSEGFLAWRAFAGNKPDMDVAALIKRATPILSDGEAAAYAAPFPDVSYKAGVKRFPQLVPDHPDAPRRCAVTGSAHLVGE